MRFEARDLKPYAVSVSTGDLLVGETYFKVSFTDDDMLVPELLLVYLERDGVDRFLLQDAGSYREGLRRHQSGDTSDIVIHSFTSIGANGIYRFEDALDVLLGCSLRRTQRGLT